MEQVLADYVVWITDLKKSPAKIVKNLWNEAVAILNHNAVEAYIVWKEKYEKMMEKIEDLMDLIDAEYESKTADEFYKAEIKDWKITFIKED